MLGNYSATLPSTQVAASALRWIDASNMVYKLRRYLISAAAALVAMQMQQVSCTSLFYDPVTSANTTDEISSKFPARGGQVTDQDCAITVEVDPTLPDITTISTVTVTYTELLANTSTAPTEAVSTLVGKAVLCETIPATDANQDAYTTTTTTSTSTSTTSSSGGKTTHTKSGTTVSQTSTSTSTTTSTKTRFQQCRWFFGRGDHVDHEDSMAGSLAEETNLTISPSTKTGVTTAPTTSTSVAGSSNVETTATASPPKTGVTTTTAAPSADETSSSTNIEVTTAPTAPSTSYSSVAGSSTEDAKSTSAPSTKTGSRRHRLLRSTLLTSATASPTKTGVVTPPTAPSVDDASKEEPNCATGWEEESSRKLRHSPMSGRRLEEKFEKKRQLEANTNKDIAKLEAYFGTSMESTLAHLPTVGVHTPSPWPGPYWPTYQDSINVIWSAGEPSPAEKYATAFGLDVDDFMNKVSADNGVDSMSSRTVCSSDSDCSSLTDGSSCAIRAGKSSGYCIPTWFGICHAWAPAAMIEEEPKCAVTHNGVTFQPMDLKALISDVYDGASVSTVFTGTRFNGGTDSTDEYGRHSSDAYRDLNPAYFHIAASNLLGKLNATFVADVTAGAEVWNQPVRGFKVYEQTEMTLEEAAQTFYGLEEYPWNAAAKSICLREKVDSYTTGAYYTYLLEMDDDGAIIGGEWVYDSDDDHPDFLWFPKAKPAADTVTSIGLSYGDVAMLLEKSVACTGSSSGSVDAGSSVSASASASASTLGSVGASTSGSTASLSLPGSDSTGSAPFTSSGTSSTGSEDAATVVPVTEAPVATETPVATQTSTDTSTTTPVSTTATPATTTATPSSNQGSNPYWNGNGGNQGSNQHWSGHWGDNDSDDSQQDHSWLSWLHW
ncbi:Transglutaminase elicitor [Phytophthora infestans]|uniref:Transglutaminase elicitor n=1 Tax=Phytophthora infestans TaxID=4787 RepID=A0A833W564_PHYIN|nr:Transglutaminase elicitor [Phytophthora infestans]